MSILELLEEYLDGKRSAISAIRTISGIFNPDHAVILLAVICAITRVEEGDLSKETMRSIWLKSIWLTQTPHTG